MKKINYYNDGIHSEFTITYKGIELTGEAICHPTDEDMMSERTGLCIAEARANIKLM